MPSAHVAMDGGKSCPQHEQQLAADALCSIPGFCSPLAVPPMEVRLQGDLGEGDAQGCPHVPRRSVGRGTRPPLHPGSPGVCVNTGAVYQTSQAAIQGHEVLIANAGRLC